MPYIISVREYGNPPMPGPNRNVAVATLDEAHTALLNLLAEYGYVEPIDLRECGVRIELPSTVIEVVPADEATLAELGYAL
jgi:hypothetical protein